MSEGGRRLPSVEGTLSLFDWRPPSAEPEREPVPSPQSSPQAPPAQLRVIVFDCETTGIDFMRDQVIELCVQHGLDHEAQNQVWRIKPSVPIHPAAQNVHGISMEDLAGCATFADYADEIARVFAAADVIIGYNISFDIDMLQAEYLRINRPQLDLTGKKVVDAFRLWQQCEPRSLQHAHRRFVGDEFAAAHSASADVAATGRVLVGMLEQFGMAGQEWSQIASICDPGGRQQWVGPSRHLRWDNEVIVVGFGKYSGLSLSEIAAGPDRSFLDWVLSKDFPPHVQEICKAALERAADELHAWVRQRYGQSAPTAAPPFAAAALGSAPTTTPPPFESSSPSSSSSSLSSSPFAVSAPSSPSFGLTASTPPSDDASAAAVMTKPKSKRSRSTSTAS
jgi:DNA polymerase III subunit epsilon